MRETLFKQVHYTLGSLIEHISLGSVGLPDIQRPFVWKNKKVRDLFDSMYRGYPVGYLLFWQNAYDNDSRAIGRDPKQLPPRLLIVDGQQRLTSLYAVIKGIQVIRENFRSEAIEIAFNPEKETFEVADAAIRRDKSYISNISALWADDANLFDLVAEYLAGLGSTRDVVPKEKQQIQKAINELYHLLSFPFTVLELSSQIDEEQVAEVFVRINSKGTPLNQADFILTLMSVFWDEGRTELESFCRESRRPSTRDASPFNHFIQPDPDQLLRVSVGLAFKRARLQYVYSILRGKDLETEEFSEERRDAQFDILKGAQARVLNLQHWHDYFKAIQLAGYRGGRMISSKNNLLFTYVLYLLGRTEYRVDEFTLRQTIARWFFMTSLTGRYTSSPESAFEFDLARLRDVDAANDFVSTLDHVCDATLTSDFWSITLPNDLATSSPQSPSLFAYYAALVLLEAKALYSRQNVVDLLDPSVHAHRAAVERHHLFPKAHLKRQGLTSTRDTNQIANYALAEWKDNADIGERGPAEYFPGLRDRYDARSIERMHYWHALPDGWESMDYREFLEARRELIAGVIADGYHCLGTSKTEFDETQVDVQSLVDSGEGSRVEFKSTLRTNLHTRQKDPRMELACLKTIAGMVNTKGGTLLIGVTDDGSSGGLEADGFPSADKMNLHLIHLVRDRIGAQHLMYVHPRFEDYEGQRIMAVECWPSKSPVFVRDGSMERFYIRSGAATTELTASQTQEFIKGRFPG